jgi:hypothetical protein
MVSDDGELETENYQFVWYLNQIAGDEFLNGVYFMSSQIMWNNRYMAKFD